MAEKFSLQVINLAEARYECIYGRGCDGICCQNGRPPVSAEEQARIDANLERFLALLTEKQRRVIEEDGYLSRRVKSGVEHSSASAADRSHRPAAGTPP